MDRALELSNVMEYFNWICSKKTHNCPEFCPNYTKVVPMNFLEIDLFFTYDPKGWWFNSSYKIINLLYRNSDTMDCKNIFMYKATCM